MSIKDPIYSVNKNQLKNIVNQKILGNICRKELCGINRDHILLIINDAVIRVNVIVFHTYNFIKLYVLYLYDKGHEIPLIDDDFVFVVIRTISYRTETRGAPPSQKKQDLTNSLNKFFNKHYNPLIKKDDLVNDDKLSYILNNYEIPDIVKNINNNIKEHFIDHIKKYVNDYFNIKDQINKIKSNRKLKDGQQKDSIREITSKFSLVKYDLLSVNEPFKSDKDYHVWIKNTRKLILPKHEFLKDSIFYDLEVNPQKYLASMITINKQIAKLSVDRDIEYKLFNVIPLRTSISPKYITIDTCVLNSLFSGKADNFNDVTAISNILWSSIFSLNSKAFKRSSYKFHEMIKTDGVGCSILFEKMTEEEKKLVKITQGEFDPEVESNKKVKGPIRTKAKYRKRGKAKKKTKQKDKIINYENKNIFKYIDDVPITNNMCQKKIIAIDPGHNDLINCMMQLDAATKVVDEIVIGNNEVICKTKVISDITFRYTRKQRNRETKTIRYRKITNRIKSKDIKKLEAKLSDYNSKTCSFKKFKEYLAKKIEVNRKLYSHYRQEIYRKLKLNRYINTQKSETKMLKDFQKHFGAPNEVIIIFGDYDVKSTIKGSEPHIAKRMKQILREYGYEVYLIDEYNTSKLCNRCCSETERFRWIKKESTDKKTGKKSVREYLLWKLLRCKSEECATYHNRDHNAVRNMIKITKCIIEGCGRPKEYARKETRCS